MEAEKTPDNVVILNHDPIVDPLRQGLLLLCRQLGRPLGDAELVDGMPLEKAGQAVGRRTARGRVSG